MTNDTDLHVLKHTDEYRRAISDAVEGRDVVELGVGTGALTRVLFDAGASEPPIAGGLMKHHDTATSVEMQVVSAVIVRNGRVLLTQRDPSRSDYGFMWESPGGQVEPAETHLVALRREVREELGVESLVGYELAAVVAHNESGCEVRLTFYMVDIGHRTPTAREAIGLGWFTADEIAALDMTPGNRLFRERLMAIARSSK